MHAEDALIPQAALRSLDELPPIVRRWLRFVGNRLLNRQSHRFTPFQRLTAQVLGLPKATGAERDTIRRIF